MNRKSSMRHSDGRNPDFPFPSKATGKTGKPGLLLLVMMFLELYGNQGISEWSDPPFKPQQDSEFAVINDSKRHKCRRVYQCRDWDHHPSLKHYRRAGKGSGWTRISGSVWREEESHWESCMEYQARRGRESTETSFTKWLLTGSKCRSDRIFCRVGGGVEGGMEMEGKKK